MKSLTDGLNLPNLALPWHQQLMMRIYVGPFMANSMDASANRKTYEGFSRRIIELVSDIPFAQHKIPVLVPAQVGLLDDTRYWSIAMTLEHLLMVDAKAKEIILKLAQGEDAGIKVTPRGVKPSGQADPEKILADYIEFVPTQLDEIEQVLSTSSSKKTEVHPIFGDFTALQWQWSLGARTALRFKQLKNICLGLTYDPASERRFNRSPESPGV